MLDIRNIVKQYAQHIALDDVSLTIPQGKIFGLLGPNGAGKTSLIRIINQIIAPDAGAIYFDGEPLSQKHIHQIGYLPEERGLYKKMKVGEQMIYLAQLKGLGKREAKQKLIQWFERLQMENWWNKKLEDLSKGMQQKVQFVSTVLHEPKLIILDEPFSGFDPVNAQIIQEEILRLNQGGATIIYSTHRMETVEELCDNIALINKSKKILDGPVADIKQRYDNRIYEITYVSTVEPIDWHHPTLFDIKAQHPGHRTSKLQIQIKEEASLNEVIVSLVDRMNILEIRQILPSIHDIFIENVNCPPPAIPIPHG